MLTMRLLNGSQKGYSIRESLPVSTIQLFNLINTKKISFTEGWGIGCPVVP